MMAIVFNQETVRLGDCCDCPLFARSPQLCRLLLMLMQLLEIAARLNERRNKADVQGRVWGNCRRAFKLARARKVFQQSSLKTLHKVDMHHTKSSHSHCACQTDVARVLLAPLRTCLTVPDGEDVGA